MAKYDSPGFNSPLPGVGRGYDRAGCAPGSDGTVAQHEGPPASRVVGDPVISTPYASSQVPANVPRAAVPADQTQVPGQVPMREPFTQVDNTYTASFPGEGTPDSHISTPWHPNSLGTGPVGNE